MQSLAAIVGKKSDAVLRGEYEALIERPDVSMTLEDRVEALRRKVLVDGLPHDEDDYASGRGKQGSLRSAVWKILLRIETVSADEYGALVERGVSKYYQKIRNDTFRTFRNDEKFKERVPEEQLIRVLNAFITDTVDRNESYAYVQGMNVICAPFLYSMPELDAYYCVRRVFKKHCPMYIQPQIPGAYAGVRLVDRVLAVCDPELHAFLQSKGLNAPIYAMPSVLSFSACTPPLTEVMRLWDFLIAFGFHVNIICTVAQVVSIRTDLLAAKSPNLLLRDMPPLDADLIVGIVAELVPRIPEDLYELLVRHMTEHLDEGTL